MDFIIIISKRQLAVMALHLQKANVNYITECIVQ